MKTAVVLAARHERDAEIPYPLMQYNGVECLLDRTLSILREYEYDNIYIVTGFCAYLFDKYNSEYVHIVYNPKYEFCSSMESLSLVAPYINEDFLLIEGDTFFEKKVVESLTNLQHTTCLIVTEETGSGDECYVETLNGFVSSITKDRHCVHRIEGELVGISKISLVVFHRMLDLYRTCTNPYLNYEYVLMDVTSIVERPYIRFKNLIWGDVDTQNDFKALQQSIYRALCRKENPYDEENLRMNLLDIFSEEKVASAQIIQIGGMSNKNFKVIIGCDEYVLRVPGNGSEGMVERGNEEFNAVAVSKMGITPPIKYFNAHTGIKLAEYIPNAETLNAATIQRMDNMDQVVRIYRSLHTSRIRLRNEFNVFKEIEKYDMLIEQVHAKMYLEADEMRSKICSIENFLNELGVELKPCHNDAVAENFIKGNKGIIYLIDWEYSGMNDPMADFAALFLENNFSKENQDYVLTNYFEGTIPQSVYDKILCYQILWDYLWAQWTVIKEAKGDDFGTYGIDRLLRAKNNLKLLNIN